jgi:hypothetical protein
MRSRKALLCFAVSCGWAGAPALSFGQPEATANAPIRVHLSTLKKVFAVGEPIRVELRVTNSGDVPVLIANRVSPSSGEPAVVQFEVTDAHGRSSPVTSWIVDRGPTELSDEDAAAKLLGSWVLLYPRTSMVFEVPVSAAVFQFLSTPGSYTLSGRYASNGIRYAGNSDGISGKRLDSLPYESWSGNVSMNEISLTIVPARKTNR